MGREQRRKDAHKKGQNLKKIETLADENNKKVLKKYGFILGGVCLFFLALYLGLGIFVTKEITWFSKDKDNITENKDSKANTVSDSILAKSILKQSEDDYYVYFYDFDEEDTNLTSVINSKLANYKLYKVNTSDGLNKNYVSETGNKDAKSIEELQVVTPTLIRVITNNIVEYYETVSEIEEALN